MDAKSLNSAEWINWWRFRHLLLIFRDARKQWIIPLQFNYRRSPMKLWKWCFVPETKDIDIEIAFISRRIHFESQIARGNFTSHIHLMGFARDDDFCIFKIYCFAYCACVCGCVCRGEWLLGGKILSIKYLWHTKCDNIPRVAASVGVPRWISIENSRSE